MLFQTIIFFILIKIDLILSYAPNIPHPGQAGSANPIDPSTMRYFYTDNSMDQSVAYKYLHQYEQQELKEEILHVLGLEHRHKPKKNAIGESSARYLIDLYTTLNNDIIAENNGWINNDNSTKTNLEIDLQESDVIISFVNQIKTQRNNRHLARHRDRRFWFNVTDVLDDWEIIDAELRIYRDLKRSHLNSTYPLQLTLFQLLYGFNNQVIMNYVHSLKIDGNFEGWLSFNVTLPMMEWAKFPQQNLGLFLQIRTPNYRKDLSPKRVGLISSRGLKEYQPFMIAYMKSKNGNELQTPTPSRVKVFENSRSRRAVMNRKRSDTIFYDADDRNPFLNSHDSFRIRSCQKRTLFVSFRDLNWQDWIIAPEGYSAAFCDGECSFPMGNEMNATNHAIVQHMMHIMNRDVPKPCCAPSKLTPIMVLYFDENSNVVLKKFNQMVVHACGCH